MIRDESTIIDLISDRIQDRVTIDVPDNNLDIGDVYRALDQAYARRHDDLVAQFAL